MMPRPVRTTTVLGVALATALLALPAFSQQDRPTPRRPNPARAGQQPGTAPGQPGLPNWHPPVNQRPGGSKGRLPTRPPVGKRFDPQKIAQQLKDQRAALKAMQKRKYPRDEHGNCVGDGPNDRPKPVNWFHGWLGSTDKGSGPKGFAFGEEGEAKSHRRPSVRWNPEEDLTSNLKAQWPLMKWNLTPYPYRYENHDDHCDRNNQPVPLVANIINISALVFLLVRFGRRPVRDALKKRRDTIMSEIDKAKTIRDKAKNRLAQYNDQLEHLDEKLEELKKQYQAEGQHEEEQVLRDMAETRDRLMADAKFLVSQESKASLNQLSENALSSSLDAAEELLKRSVTQADHDRLAEEYLAQIGPALKQNAIGSASEGKS